LTMSWLWQNTQFITRKPKLGNHYSNHGLAEQCPRLLG
jgi:hypothetical protein